MSPSRRRRRTQMIERRKHLGFTQETLAQALGVSTSSIAQWERGSGTPTPRHRRGLAALLEVGLPGLDQLLDPDADPLALEHQVARPVPFTAIALEQEAAEVRSFELALVPGVLQAPAYAEALIRGYYEPAGEDDIATRVETRLSRQRALTRDEDPLRFRAVIDESVLRRLTGSVEVMVEQLELLASLSTLPNVQVRILPLEAAAHASAAFPFWLLVRPGESEPYMVCTENASSIEYGEMPLKVEQHTRLFAYLERTALDPERSRTRIHEVRKQLKLGSS